MLNVIWQLILMQWRSFVRQPSVLFWALGFPVLLSALLGVAFKNRQPAALPIVIVAETAERPAVDELLKELGPAPRLTIRVADEAAARLALKRGKVLLAILDIRRGPKRSFLLDESNGDSELALLRCKAWLRQDNAASGIVALESKGSRYIDFMLPGLFASSLINSCLWGVGWMLIDFRQKKFMRRMVATPLRRRDFFISLLLGRLVFISLEFFLLFGFARWLFGVEIQGSYGAFLLVMLAGLLAFFGLGILMASRTDKPQVGIGLINALTLPMFVISGMFFSYERFPAAMQVFCRAFPPTMMVDSLRAIMNEGAGYAQAGPAALALGLMGLLCMAIGNRIFRWY